MMRWVRNNQVACISINFLPCIKDEAPVWPALFSLHAFLNRGKLEVSSVHWYMLVVSPARLGPAPGSVYRNE